MSAVPTPYDRQANFVTLSQGNGNITVSQISTQLDAEFDAVNTSLDQTQSRLAEIQRDDGAIAYGVVSAAALAADALALIASNGGNFKGSWTTATAYTVGQSVAQGGNVYYCLQSHTSGTFATDLTANLWVVGGLGDGAVTSVKLADNSVTSAKLAPGAVITADIADSAVTAVKLAPSSVTTAKIADGSITAAKIDSNAKLGGATGAGTDRVFFENDQTVSTSYTITSGKNAMSAGPITIASGVVVTVPSGSTYTIV